MFPVEPQGGVGLHDPVPVPPPDRAQVFDRGQDRGVVGDDLDLIDAHGAVIDSPLVVNDTEPNDVNTPAAPQRAGPDESVQSSRQKAFHTTPAVGYRHVVRVAVVVGTASV